MKIGVIGAGSWGTALAIHLAGLGYDLYLWDLDTEHLRRMAEDRENKDYLPGIVLPNNIHMEFDEDKALKDADIALFSVPAQHFASAFTKALPMLPENATIVNVAKGIDQNSLKTMSQIALEIKPDAKYVVLSGPSHAEEVGRNLPAAVVVASNTKEPSRYIRDVFMDENFRIYVNDDVIGVELGGSLKNIIALGAGISDGLGFGDNAKAAMMTRGIVEMTRLGVKMGADPASFSGLSGIGDLIVTCCSMHSRNRRCGILIGKGMDPKDAVKEVGMVVEGMYTADSAYRLAKELDVNMPITEAIYNVVHGNMSAEDAVNALMNRSKKHEKDYV